MHDDAHAPASRRPCAGSDAGTPTMSGPGGGSEPTGPTRVNHALPELARVAAELFSPFRAMAEAWDGSHGWRGGAVLVAYAVILRGLHEGMAVGPLGSADGTGFADGGLAAAWAMLLVGAIAALYGVLATVSIGRGLWRGLQPGDEPRGLLRKLFVPDPQRRMLDPVDWNAVEEAIAGAEARRAAEPSAAEPSAEERARARRERWTKGLPIVAAAALAAMAVLNAAPLLLIVAFLCLVPVMGRLSHAEILGVAVVAIAAARFST